MKKAFVVFTLSVLSLLRPAQANENVELTANVVKNTCQLMLDNNGYIDLGTQFVDSFDSGVTPDDLYQNGKTFYVHLLNCDIGNGSSPTRVVIRFHPKSGSLSRVSNQIFTNENALGAKNVGIVILSIQDANHPYNVLNVDGSPKSVFAWSPTAANASYPFYTRMQKEIGAQPISPGSVNTSVLVEAYYE